MYHVRRVILVLSDECMTLLQQCARINPHLVVSPGSVVGSITPRRNRFLQCTLPDVFPVEFRLHDLSGFLRQLGLFDKPDIEFDTNRMVISDQFGAKSEYQYSKKEDLIYMDRQLNIGEFTYSIHIPDTAIDKILRSAAANAVEDIALVGEGGFAYLKSMDKKKNSRVFSVKLGKCDRDFCIYLKHSKKNKLIIMPMSYDVSVSDRGILKFDSMIGDASITYYMACERDSII